MANTPFIFLSSLFIICMVAKEVTSCSQEEYWKMKLPNVPIPKPISNSLSHSNSGVDHKAKANLNQPYTVYSWKYKADDKDNAKVDQPYTVYSWKYQADDKDNAKIDQPYTVYSWKYKADNKANAKVDQPFTVGSRKYKADDKDNTKVDQPYTVYSWKYKADNKDNAKVDQPFTVGSWKYKADDKDNAKVDQPYTVYSWKYKADNKDNAKVDQPYTVYSWKYKADNKDNAKVDQPFTVGSWKYKADDKGNAKVNQPYTVYSWKYKADDKDNAKVNQPYTVYSWKYKAEDKDNAKVDQPYTVYSWKYKTDDKDNAKVDQPYTVYSWKYKADNEDNAKVDQPYTVYSWKYKEDNKEKDVKDKSMNNDQRHSHFMHHLNGGEDKDMVGGSVFFIEENLKLGKKLRHDFQKNPKANFLPRDIASSMPFAVDRYSEILDRLSIDPNSAEATSVKETLSLCLERPHVKKENRTCVQSMEDLVDFVIRELGTNNVKVATMSTSEDRVPTGMQDYRIAKLNKLEIPNGDGVACHKMVYPYAVYWCHHQQDIGQYAVTLVNNDGITVDTTAVCHYDTYAWEPEVPALRYLGIRPGDAPVCHFAAINDMFWSLNGKTTVGTPLKLPNGGVAQ